MQTLHNLRIKNLKPLFSPSILIDEQPLTDKAAQTILKTRQALSDIFSGKDQRLLVVVGPCSIHDSALAVEYAQKLKSLSEELNDALCVVMRVYFEKPRTTVGWKGLINDPDLDNSFNINKGLRVARKLLVDLNDMGMPCATEFLDTTIPQYISDCISWAAIGARTTESQIHREMASGLSMPIGFKNGTTGNVQIAVDAVMSASTPHRFLGVTQEGLAAIVETDGNPYAHVILRGGADGPNYQAEHVQHVMTKLEKVKMNEKVMIDASHGNSQKDHNKQVSVIENIADRLQAGEQGILGLMIESHLNPGNQKLVAGQPLQHGVSITDKCIGWETTQNVLKQLAESIRKRNGS